MKQSDAFGEEGQRLISRYIASVEKFNALIQESDDGDVKELELRQRLTKRYGIEFPPLELDDPVPPSNGQTPSPERGIEHE